jgi:catalase
MSERGIPKSFRHMHGFGSHTYSFINAMNERTWVKFTFKTQQSIENLSDEQATSLIGADRESHQRDLFESIERGEFPRWKMYIQVMTEEAAATHRHNPFDLTKVWPHADYPLHEVGYFELNRNPENFFAEVEQASFTPANIVPGIGFSPDKMLQARLFSYGDAARYRLGVNHHQIPVNAPKCPYHSYHRDGAMRIDGNHGATTSYVPNSADQWAEQPDYRVDEDHYEQPGNLFRAMSADQKRALFENTARAMAGTSVKVQERHIVNCTKADLEYGAGIARALGFTIERADE